MNEEMCILSFRQHFTRVIISYIDHTHYNHPDHHNYLHHRDDLEFWQLEDSLLESCCFAKFQVNLFWQLHQCIAEAAKSYNANALADVSDDD